MQSSYKEKEKEVEDGVEHPRYDFLTPVRLATTGNTNKFDFKGLTEQQVARKIEKALNKESFCDDKISYGVLKRLPKWIVPELTRIFNMSLQLSTFPDAGKVGRIMPLYKVLPATELHLSPTDLYAFCQQHQECWRASWMNR